MKKCLLLAVLLFAVVAVPRPVRAAICAVDNVPAATVLLPYFEVDLNNPNGVDTAFTVVNASATAVLGHVVLWTDLGIPTYAWDIYLTGYDAEKVDLRFLFGAGVVPRTASAGQDPSDVVSPKGPFSQDINFASCTGILPQAPLSATLIAHLRAAHTGLASATFGGNCSGRAVGDNIARGYITIDTVNSCGGTFPDDPAYLSNVITSQNVLYGNFEFINRTNSTSFAGPLVAIEGSFTNPETNTAGQYTFYGRFNGYTATDHREPIATQWQTRILSSASFGQNTDVIVWRDPGVTQAPFACGGSPAWYPLPLENLVLFDEQEHPVIPPASNVFAAAAQRVSASALSDPFASGYLRLSLSLPSGTTSTTPPEDPRARQAYAFAVTSSAGKYGIGLSAFALDSACSVAHDQAPTVSQTAVAFTNPGDGATSVSVSATVRFFFNQNVAVTSSAFQLECPTGTPVSFTTAPSPPGHQSQYTLTPSVPLPASTTCRATAVASQITGDSTVGQHPAADKVITFTTAP